MKKATAAAATSDPTWSPPIPLEQSGTYIIRNLDTLSIQRAWLTIYHTAIEFDGELLERSAFLAKYAAIEFFPNDSSTPITGDTFGGEDME